MPKPKRTTRTRKRMVERVEANPDLSTKDLAAMRAELDGVDREIIAAINRRAAIAKRIGQVKAADGQPAFDSERERDILENAEANNDGPLSDEGVRSIFRELVSATRAVQTPIRVAYLGPEYTFSHLAAIDRFGQSAALIPVGTIAAVFEEVERGQAQYGVVP